MWNVDQIVWCLMGKEFRYIRIIKVWIVRESTSLDLERGCFIWKEKVWDEEIILESLQDKGSQPPWSGRHVSRSRGWWIWLYRPAGSEGPWKTDLTLVGCWYHWRLLNRKIVQSNDGEVLLYTQWALLMFNNPGDSVHTSDNLASAAI